MMSWKVDKIFHSKTENLKNKTAFKDKARTFSHEQKRVFSITLFIICEILLVLSFFLYDKCK